MDIAAIPIVEFLKFCKKGAIQKGYSWIACILCRTSDCRNLYSQIERDWKSLDNITGKNMLVLFAGNEEHYINFDEYCVSDETVEYCVSDETESYVKRYNPFATIIGNSKEIKTDLTSVRFRILQEHFGKVESNQIDAIDSLRRYFEISEEDIPCIVYVPLNSSTVPARNIVVCFPKGEIDLYSYFKHLFNRITPLLDELTSTENELGERIKGVYNELLSLAESSPLREEILEHVNSKQYLTCEQPIRGKLSKYIDLCKKYKTKYGENYQVVETRKSDLLSQIESALYQERIPSEDMSMRNVYISIGDNNKIENSKIGVFVKTEN